MPTESHAQLKKPPQFLAGERAVLGGLLIDNEALHKVLAVLSPDDFYKETHRDLYRSIMDLFEKGQPVDLVTVTKALQDSGTFERVGGIEFLTELVDEVFSAANIEHYSTLVKEKAVLRQLISKSTEIITRCYEDQESLDEFLDEAEQIIFSIGESRIQAGFVSAHDLMYESFQMVEMLYEHKQSVTGVPSGFTDLDYLTGGFQNSDLIIIAGRPAMGKTSFALNVAMNAAVDHQVPSAIFSLEMSKEQIGLRMLCSKAKVNLRNLRTGFLGNEDWGRLTLGVGGLSEAPIFVDDSPALNPLEMRAKTRRLKKEKGLGLVVVDYLQLMRGATKSDSREKEISEISRSLKALAKELSVPVIALSQLNRKVEDRPDKRPHLADLRESGAIEQDADVIIFIYRDEVYNKSEENPKKGEAEIIIGKQRNGPIGSIKAHFKAAYSTFLPYTPIDEPPQDDSAVLSNL